MSLQLYTHESLASKGLNINVPDAARDALVSFFNKGLEPNRKILQVILEINLEPLKRAQHVEIKREISSEFIDPKLNLYATGNRHERLLEIDDLAIMNTDYEPAETNLNTFLSN